MKKILVLISVSILIAACGQDDQSQEEEIQTQEGEALQVNAFADDSAEIGDEFDLGSQQTASYRCSKGRKVCKSRIWGQICYNPKTHYCGGGGIPCRKGHKRCGVMSCYNPKTHFCFKNNSVCHKRWATCGNQCYPKGTMTCIKGHACRRGHALCGNHYCFNPKKETCIRGIPCRKGYIRCGSSRRCFPSRNYHCEGDRTCSNTRPFCRKY